jgi:hypothetical protein
MDIPEISLEMDAETQLIRAVAWLAKDLKKERKLAVLEYLMKRYESGDNFGLY